jgi:hypothetical protein
VRVLEKGQSLRWPGQLLGPEDALVRLDRRDVCIPEEGDAVRQQLLDAIQRALKPVHRLER